jgi:hypothetical protein
MHTLAPRPASAAARLRAALEETAAALAVPKLEALLNVESALTAALAALPTIRSLDPADRPAAREDLLAAQAALARCRRLGAALGDFVRVSLDARGQGITYESAPGTASRLSGRAFQTRA